MWARFTAGKINRREVDSNEAFREVSIEEAGQCTTYGIACVFKDSTAGKSQAITIADISVDRAFVEDTANFFNRISLSPHCFRRAVMEIIP